MHPSLPPRRRKCQPVQDLAGCFLLRTVILARTEAELRTALEADRARGARTGLVPTRGGLHEGKLSLVDRCRSLADVCVVSTSPGPPRFSTHGANAYGPRDLERDCESAAARGAHVVFAPTTIESDPDSEGAPEGGMATLLGTVRELLRAVRPQLVVVGRKDLRWATSIRRLASEFDPDIETEVAPIVRAQDGVALSLANQRLSQEQRRQAVGLVRALELARAAYKAGQRSAGALTALIRDEVDRRPLLSTECAEIVRVRDLALQDPVGEGSAALVVARCGPVLLADNMLLSSTP